MAKKPSKPLHPLHYVKSYFKGVHTKESLFSGSMRILTEETVKDLIEQSPKEILEFIDTRTAGFPADDDDEGWSKIIHIRSVCYASWAQPTKEQIDAERKQDASEFRRGVGIYRKARNIMPGCQSVAHPTLFSFYTCCIRQYQAYPGYRLGQALFNHLIDIRPDLADAVRSTNRDPFHCETLEDKRFWDFIDFLEANWYRQPNEEPIIPSPSSSKMMKDR